MPSRSRKQSATTVAKSTNEKRPRSSRFPRQNVNGRQIASGHWGRIVPEAEWRIYQKAIEALQRRGVEILLGGAFGLAAFTGRWRNTKDIDFFILPNRREEAIAALHEIGFKDYYDQLPYDRGWIYRATRDGLIVDLIWGTPNRRTEVDALWFERAPEVRLRKQRLGVIPPEELLWIKLYVLQRERCDWPDILNLLYVLAGQLDWDHLLSRVEEDAPLLAGVLHVFAWLCPDKASLLPDSVISRFGVDLPMNARKPVRQRRRRIDLLDTRPWFAAWQPPDRAMNV